MKLKHLKASFLLLLLLSFLILSYVKIKKQIPILKSGFPSKLNKKTKITLSSLIEKYQYTIKNIRNEILRHEILKVTKKSKKWTLLDGYDENVFLKVANYSTIIPVYLTASMSLTKQILPVRKYYNHVASWETCRKMSLKIYGPPFLNKSCVTDIKQVYQSVSINKAQLSVGLPFKLNVKVKYPMTLFDNDVLLHFGFIVKDALLLSHGIVFSNGSALQPQRCKPRIKIKVPNDQENLPTFSEVFSLTEQTDVLFYHLTTEDLPRIAPYLGFLLENPNIKIHCKNKSFHLHMLKFLGLGEERFIFGNLRAELLYMPAGTACGRPGAFSTQLLSTLFHQRMPKDMLSQKQDTLVLIKRSSVSRQFIHHQKIFKMLKDVAIKHKLRAVEYKDDPVPSFLETLDIFYRAKLVIAPHGAGLSNLIFSRPGVIVLESFCIVNLCFRNLMSNLGHIHHGYMKNDFSCLQAQASDFKNDIEKHLQFVSLRILCLSTFTERIFMYVENYVCKLHTKIKIKTNMLTVIA